MGEWKPEEALDLWKFFGEVGTADKNTMVSVATWLVGGSAALVWFVVKEWWEHPFAFSHPWKAGLVALVGVVTSCAAWRVTLIYAGYSNWNWAHADAIARAQRCRELAKDAGASSHSRERSRWDPMLPEYGVSTLGEWRSVVEALSQEERKRSERRPWFFAKAL